MAREYRIRRLSADVDHRLSDHAEPARCRYGGIDGADTRHGLTLTRVLSFISYNFLSRAILIAWAGLTINFLSGAALFTPRGVEKEPTILR